MKDSSYYTSSDINEDKPRRKNSSFKFNKLFDLTEELDGPAVSALRRAIAEVKQRWSVMRWVVKICHLELVPAAFTVVSTHQSALGPRGGLWPFLLMCNA
jgi:hypothetical protein